MAHTGVDADPAAHRDRCAADRPPPRHQGPSPSASIPGGHTVADAVVNPVDPGDTAALDRLLDQYGYTVDHWVNLPGGVRYGTALPGRLAERDWYTLARVRIVKETAVGAVDPRVDRTFLVGEELTMNQRGQARPRGPAGLLADLR